MKKIIIPSIAILGIIIFIILILPSTSIGTTSYTKQDSKVAETPKVEEKNIHIKAHDSMKGIYMSSFAASDAGMRNYLLHIATSTEINTIVLDIKDYTGEVAFKLRDPKLSALGVDTNRIKDIDGFLETLHKNNIYVIGRIAVFQDPLMVKLKPEIAVKRDSDKSVVWKDRKGMPWIDAGSEEYHKYIVDLSKESYSRGFDEINFDYIRYPTDGNMKDIYYPSSQGQAKHVVMRNFFEYLHNQLSPLGIPLSADLFGMTTTNNDDLGIGQKLEDALSFMDYVDPMVYPSHYPATWSGIKKPADHPYEVIKISMQGAINKLNALKSATTTPEDIKKRLSLKQLRPWIQDFNLGATYTASMVKTQIQATYDLGLSSWLIWNASNRYTLGALEGK